MKNKVTVGLHTFYHDGSICVFDHNTEEIKYLKFERITGVKHQFHNDYHSWIKYLNYLGYSEKDVDVVFLADTSNLKKISDFPEPIVMYPLDHHICHHWSTGGFNSLVFDNIGSQYESLSIFKKNQCQLKLTQKAHSSLSIDLNRLWHTWFVRNNKELFQDEINNVDFAGYTMALHGFGKDCSQHLITPSFTKEYTDNAIINYMQFKEKMNSQDETFVMNSFVTSLHFYWYKKIKNHLSRLFKKNYTIKVSGGVGHNIVLNTLLKKDFPNLDATPHCGDEGLSIGALRWGVWTMHRKKLKLNFTKMKQQDENLGKATSSIIKKIAEDLAQNKIVLWGQGWGEIGPRALGYRSILMNPCTKNGKEIINNKIKKRIWFRPYGASVLKNKYHQYFDLPYESDWMLYQAEVKDKDKFKNITHVDGTCRIQTVHESNETFNELLYEFEKLTGYPVFLNTSMNLPGNPIAGTKNQITNMFKNSQADILAIGNERMTHG